MRFALALLAFLVAVPASAGHYFIVDVPDVVPEAHHKALAAAGIQTTADLYDRIAKAADRRAFASRTGIPERDLGEWARFIDLMQLSGIGPKMVRLLNAAEVPNLKALQGADPASLSQKMKEANRGNRFSELVPDADVVKGWVGQARKVTLRLE